MDNFLAVGIAEGFIEAESEEQTIEAWQHLHDTGLAYQLQGWFGRQAKALLDEGLIHETEPEQPTEPPPGYKILSDGIIDPYYAIKDDDMGTIVGGTHAHRQAAVADAWQHWHNLPPNALNP